MDDPLIAMAASDPLVLRIREAAHLIDSTAGMVRVISHYDGDGICAAGILAKALMRADKRFHVSNVSVLSKEDVLKLEGGYSLLMISDMGSSMAPDISARVMELGIRCIMLDHHQADRTSPYSISDGRGILEINPRYHSINSATGCCGSTLAFLLAVALDVSNIDLGVFALAGAIADRQNVPGFLEVNSNVRDHLQNKGMIKSATGLPLQGKDVAESLFMSNDPFIADLAGDRDKVVGLLKALGVDPSSNLVDLPREKLKLLQSFLYVHLLRNGADPGAVHELFRESALSPEWGDLQTLGFEIDACGRVDDSGTGLDVIWGDKQARERAYRVRKEYRDKVQSAVRAVRDAGPRRMDHIDVVQVPEEKMAGVIAGIAHNLLFSHVRPVLSVSTVDGQVKVSSRGNRALCNKGLNLGKVMNEASKGVGGSGGGHDVAAGATIPETGVEDFLRASDRMVGEQIGRKKL